VKKLLVVGTLAGLVLAGGVAMADDAAAPKMVIAESIKDFGSVPKGDPISYDFAIRNEGKADLVIDSVKPSCGCTVADFTKVIKPGETGKATLKVETKNFEGPITKSATVTSNDPTTPTTTLVIKAIVKPFVSVLPQSFVRFAGLEGEASTQSVTLVSEEKGPFSVQSVDTTKPYIQAKVTKLSGNDKVAGKGEGDQYRLDISLGKDAPVGLLAEKVTAHTNLDKAKTVEVTVSGLVRPVIQVTPAKVNFGTVNSAATEPVPRNLIIQNNREEVKDFKVTKTELVMGTAETAKMKSAKALKGIAVEVQPIQEGSRYQISLKTTPELAKGPINGTLLIHTSDKDHPVFDVEISGTVQ